MMKNETYVAQFKEKYKDKPDELMMYVKAIDDFYAFLIKASVENEQDINRQDVVS